MNRKKVLIYWERNKRNYEGREKIQMKNFHQSQKNALRDKSILKNPGKKFIEKSKKAIIYSSFQEKQKNIIFAKMEIRIRLTINLSERKFNVEFKSHINFKGL